ncbi:lysylphosphatidylglycerol synthetase [Chroococcidiopsis sp. CCALA 051]|uniref:lysylphosphatidylglycerol synthase transmembrane domain-containing protein n=1 Tax=Chroococcidiopsis sp. CCALA 051 TaxID=869949 RepID=UPI000D0CFB50|nr:lysylphosphatidylglycerol synthase transmembrane domain-containing protein [Chroococcidiopsis sp. CCALA 051]PSM47920.1 lysylphosphatidylglycerol synthetase [Chroococcidiopsis sp. CCALA 051]
MKVKPIFLIKLIVSAGILALVLTRMDFYQVWVQFQYLSPSFIIFALLFYTGCQLLSCWRWQVVLWSSGHSAPMSSLLSSYFAGMFLNIFLPGALGGDVYRVYRVAQSTKDSEVALVSVFLERFTGLAALSGLAVIGLVPAFKLIGRWDILLLFTACVGSLVGAVLLIASPKLLIWAEPWLIKFRLSAVAARFAKIQILLRTFAQHRQALLLSMGLSLLLQLAIVYYHYIVAHQLNIPISYLELLVFIPIIVVVTLLPISLGGIGLKEGLWAYLFSRIGLSVEQALLLSLTITVLGWMLSLPGAVVLLLDSTGFQQVRQGNK